MSGGVGFLRDAGWLNGARATAVCRIGVVLTAAAVVLGVAFSHGVLDPFGKPLGTDFVSFWTASQLVLAGHPAESYSAAAHEAAQRALVGSAASGYFAFFYPPVFLLICLPLALLPYLWSLAAWLAVTGLAYWRGVRALMPGAGSALPILAFPAVFTNLGHGQNGFLTAALFAGAAVALGRRPLLAGVCLGCLVYKPQFLVVVPVVLLAARQWATLAGMAATALALAGTSAAVFGLATWGGFLATAPLARVALESGAMGIEKLQSSFAAVRLMGGGLGAAYAWQAAVSLAVCAFLAVLGWRRPRDTADGAPLGAAMAAGALLASPFLLDYDLTVLAVPLAWMLREATRTGFRRWEKSVLALGFLLPLFSRTVAGELGVPLGPPVLAAVFVLVLVRAGLFSRLAGGA